MIQLTSLLSFVGCEKYSPGRALSCLCRFPPDVVPLVSLVSAIFSTVFAFSNLLQGKVKIRHWIAFVGAWGGYRVVMESQTQRELKETVEKLIAELNRAEDQLRKWDGVVEEERGKLDRLQNASQSLQRTVQHLRAAFGSLKKEVTLQKELAKSYLDLILKTKEESFLAQDALGKHQTNAENMSVILERQIKELKEIRAEQWEAIKLQKSLEERLKARVEELKNLKEGS